MTHSDRQSRACAWLLCAALGLAAAPVGAEVYSGIEFPDGAQSFADVVVSFEFNDATGVSPPHDDPERALGEADGAPMALGNATEEIDVSISVDGLEWFSVGFIDGVVELNEATDVSPAFAHPETVLRRAR